MGADFKMYLVPIPPAISVDFRLNQATRAIPEMNRSRVNPVLVEVPLPAKIMLDAPVQSARIQTFMLMPPEG